MNAFVNFSVDELINIYVRFCLPFINISFFHLLLYTIAGETDGFWEASVSQLVIEVDEIRLVCSEKIFISDETCTDI